MAVETAITMPAFVFILLGMLQLGLMHQGRVMAKYAAYRAVRVGSIHNAKKPAMTRAALASVLPFAGHQRSMSFFKTTPNDFASSWTEASGMNGDASQRIITVTICEPFTSNGTSSTGDFDDPEGSLGALNPDNPPPAENETDPNAPPTDNPTASAYDWKQFNAGRLTVQVTFYHRMVIPFVNGLIWHVVRGNESTEMMRTLRLGTANTPKMVASKTMTDLDDLAAQGIYVMPIRASWAMRMQSNFLDRGGDFSLPATNECKVPWKKE